jgi:tetratricopeptide (TPR) repeat protein
MAKKKLSRKELLKGTDEFLSFSSKAVNFFNDHLRELKYVGIGLAVVIVGYLSVYTYIRHVDEKGQEAYNLAYEMLIQGKGPAVSLEDQEKSAKLFQKVVDDYGMSEAARLALPQVAHIRFLEGDYDQAIAHYDSFAEALSDTKAYMGLNHLALAACYEAKGSYKKAIDILSPVVKSQDNPFRESAMLNLERVLRLDGQTQQAEGLLKEFVQTYPNSPFLPMAKARLNKET